MSHLAIDSYPIVIEGGGSGGKEAYISVIDPAVDNERKKELSSRKHRKNRGE